MIRRILRTRRPTTPSLASISLEEELALLRVELMYGLRVNREAYLRRKMEERDELTRRLYRRDAAAMLTELRGCLERVGPRREGIEGPAKVVEFPKRRHLQAVEGPDPA